MNLNENELHASLAAALNRSNILIRRLDGTIEHWTSGCERLYGWTEAEALGRKSHDLLRTKFSAPLDKIQQEFLENGTWQGDLTQRHKDGRWLLISTEWAVLPGENGGPMRVISTHN